MNSSSKDRPKNLKELVLRTNSKSNENNPKLSSFTKIFINQSELVEFALCKVRDLNSTHWSSSSLNYNPKQRETVDLEEGRVGAKN